MHVPHLELSDDDAGTVEPEAVRAAPKSVPTARGCARDAIVVMVLDSND